MLAVGLLVASQPKKVVVFHLGPGIFSGATRWVLWGWDVSPFCKHTPRKINMEPENDGLEDDFPF